MINNIAHLSALAIILRTLFHHRTLNYLMLRYIWIWVGCLNKFIGNLPTYLLVSIQFNVLIVDLICLPSSLRTLSSWKLMHYSVQFVRIRCYSADCQVEYINFKSPEVNHVGWMGYLFPLIWYHQSTTKQFSIILLWYVELPLLQFVSSSNNCFLHCAFLKSPFSGNKGGILAPVSGSSISSPLEFGFCFSFFCQ